MEQESKDLGGPGARRAELARLAAQERGRMESVATRLLRDPDEAQDAVQDALVSAWRRIDGFRGDAALSTWLHQIVVNASLMRLRSRRRRREQCFEPVEIPQPAGPARACEEELFHRETLRRALGCVDHLEPQQREILYWRAVHHADYGELAARLGLSEGGVKTRLHRARRALRALVEAEPGAAAA